MSTNNNFDDSANIILPSVAVVILNWNGKKFLEQFLPSVVASNYNNLKIVVADNASSDNSISFLKSEYPNIILHENKSNEGFAEGYNAALKNISADYYVLLNSDVLVDKNWIEPVISLMESNKNIAAAQPKILSYAENQKFEYAGASGGWIDKFGYPFARGRVFDCLETDLGQYNNTMECFWASGAAMFIRANLFHKAGGFDSYLFAHQEEIDLCWRLQNMGYKIFVEPNSVVYHVGGGTLPQGNSKKTFLNFRNNLILLAKNLPFSIALYIVPFRFLLDGVAGLQALLKGDFGYFAAIIKAHFHFIFWVIKNPDEMKFPKKN